MGAGSSIWRKNPGAIAPLELEEPLIRWRCRPANGKL
jgi:hypothetical protein